MSFLGFDFNLQGGSPGAPITPGATGGNFANLLPLLPMLFGGGFGGNAGQNPDINAHPGFAGTPAAPNALGNLGMTPISGGQGLQYFNAPQNPLYGAPAQNPVGTSGDFGNTSVLGTPAGVQLYPSNQELSLINMLGMMGGALGNPNDPNSFGQRLGPAVAQMAQGEMMKRWLEEYRKGGGQF